MNNEQAKKVLLRFRPGTRDELDPEVREALAVAAHDPELTGWLENHRRFQQTMQAGVRDVTIPAGLREQILAERQAFFSLRPHSRRVMLASVLAGALGLILLGTLFNPWRSDPEAQFATFRSRMVRAALRGYAMELETSKPAEVRQFLAARNAHGNLETTSALEEQPLLGCAVLAWRSQAAAMICYGRAGQPELWLFVVDSAALPDPPGEQVMAFARVNRLNTVAWNRGGKTYLLAGAVDDATLRELVPGG